MWLQGEVKQQQRKEVLEYHQCVTDNTLTHTWHQAVHKGKSSEVQYESNKHLRGTQSPDIQAVFMGSTLHSVLM